MDLGKEYLEGRVKRQREKNLWKEKMGKKTTGGKNELKVTLHVYKAQTALKVYLSSSK